MNYIKYLFFTIYNLIYQLLSFGILLYGQTYLNTFLIPDKFLWNDNGTRRERTVIWGVLLNAGILIIEASLLVLIIYYINRSYLNKVVKKDPDVTLKWTTGLAIAFAIIFVIILLYSS